MKITSVLPFLVSFMSGGLAGSIFTYWVNHRDTVVIYKITTANGEPKDVVPQGAPEQDVHKSDVLPKHNNFVHNLEFDYYSAPPLRTAGISVKLATPMQNPDNPELKGIGDVFHHDPKCVPVSPREVGCTLEDIRRGAAYTITIPSHDREAPKIDSQDVILEDSVHSVGHELLYWFLPGVIAASLVAIAVKRLGGHRPREVT